MNTIQTLTITDRLVLSLDGLCRAVAARAAGRAMAEWMIIMVWQRVRRVRIQMERLLLRFQQGRLPVRRSPRSGGRRTSRPRSAQVLPRGFAWLLPMVPSEAACFAGQIRTVLADPEMVALLEAAPQARRLLAPLGATEVVPGAPATME